MGSKALAKGGPAWRLSVLRHRFGGDADVAEGAALVHMAPGGVDRRRGPIKIPCINARTGRNGAWPIQHLSCAIEARWGKKLLDKVVHQRRRKDVGLNRMDAVSLPFEQPSTMRAAALNEPD